MPSTSISTWFSALVYMSIYFLICYNALYVDCGSLINHRLFESRDFLSSHPVVLLPLSASEQPALREGCKLSTRGLGMMVLNHVPWFPGHHFCFFPQMLIIHNHSHPGLLAIKGEKLTGSDFLSLRRTKSQVAPLTSALAPCSLSFPLLRGPTFNSVSAARGSQLLSPHLASSLAVASSEQENELLLQFLVQVLCHFLPPCPRSYFLKFESLTSA